jgi:hypothetical protein
MDAEDPMKAVAAHEGFHNVYYTHKLDDAWKTAVAARGLKLNDFYSVSEYAGKNISELFSEVGSAISSGVDIPKEFLDAFYETVKTIGRAK